MASRIDENAEMMAHTVIHAMVVRMQLIADQTGKSIGLIYDLATDRMRFVDLSGGGFDRSAVFRTVTPSPAPQHMQAGAPALAGA